MPAGRDTYLGFVLEQLAPFGEVTARPMMGGRTLYREGAVFALIAHGALYLKADDGKRLMFAARGLPAFQPDPERPGTMSYYLVSADVLEDRAGEALAARRRAAEKKRWSPRRVGE